MGLDTAISWVRAHIDIRGNELVDQYAMFHSHLGQIAGTGGTTTEVGIWQLITAARAESRSAPTYRKGRRVCCKRRALAAYT